MSRKSARNVGHVKKPAAFAFTDVSKQQDVITAEHQRQVSINQMMQTMHKMTLPIWNLDKAIGILRKTVAKFTGTSKFVPHQGKQEVARRLARMSVA